MKASHKRTEISSASLKNERAPCTSAIAAQSHTMTGGILKIGSEGRATRTSRERKREISRGAGVAQARARKEKACRRSPLPAGLATPLPRILRHLSRSTCTVERKARLTLTGACRGGTAARHAPCSISLAPSRLATGGPRKGANNEASVEPRTLCLLGHVARRARRPRARRTRSRRDPRHPGRCDDPGSGRAPSLCRTARPHPHLFPYGTGIEAARVRRGFPGGRLAGTLCLARFDHGDRNAHHRKRDRRDRG